MKRKRISFSGSISKAHLPEGVTVEGNELVFQGFDDDTIQDICKRMSGLVSAFGNRKKYKPTDQDRNRIKEITGNDELDLSLLPIYRASVSSNQRDMHSDKFTEPVLQEMALQYKDGRSVVLGHNMYYVVGKTFDAEVIDEEGRKELLVKFFILPDTKTLLNTDLKLALDTRSLDRFSIGGNYKIIDVVKDEETGQRTYFYDHENIVLAHLGIVDMGANTDAVSKSASGAGISFGEIQNETEQSKPIMFKKKYSHLGEIEIELNETDVKSVLDLAEKKLDKMSEELNAFKDAKEKALTKLRDEYAAKSKELNPDADNDEINQYAEALPENLLVKEIAKLKGAIAKKKNAITPNPKGENEGGEKKGKLKMTFRG